MLPLKFNFSSFLSAKARAYLFLVPLGIVCGTGYAAYRFSKLPTSFQTTSRIVISGRLNFSEGNPVANELLSVLGTQLEIMTSEELRERAMLKLRLEQPWATIRPDLSARQLPRTTIFELTATGSTAPYLQRYLELAMEEYVAVRREQRLDSSRSVMDQISSEIARLEKTVAEQEAELFRFKQQRNIVFWEQQSTTAARFLSQLKNREASLRMQLQLFSLLEHSGDRENAVEHAAAFAIESDALPSRARAPRSAAGDAAAAQKLRLRELELEREILAGTFRPKHPRYQKVEAEITKARRRVRFVEEEDAAALKVEVQGLRGELETIRGAMDEWERKVLESSQVEAEHQKLQAGLARTRELYQRLIASVQNIDFRKGVDEEIVQILKRPGHAAEIVLNAAAAVRGGIFGGAVAGIGLMLLALRMDRRAFAVAEVRESLGLDIAAEVPLIRQTAGEAIAAARADCPSSFSESLRHLRAQLALESEMGSPVRLIAICSSTPGEGKSTLALNLAHSAAGAGFRTLVVDADLRRGTIGRLLDLPDHAPGFADILREGGDWRRGVHAVPGQNFSAMPCGSNPSSAIDLVVRRFPETLLAEARLEFDLVIIDCAPILAVSDAIPALSRVDRVLFVVRLRSAMMSTITNALQVVRRSAKSTPLLVINRTRSADGSQDHYDYQANAAHRPAR